MFYIWDIAGARKTYEPGTMSPIGRPVDRVKASNALKAKMDESTPEFTNEKSAAKQYEKVKEGTPKREKAIIAEQIMTTPIVTLSPITSVGEAREFISEKRLRHIPIVSDENRLIGIVSDRDLFLGKEQSPKGDTLLQEVMASPVLSAGVDTEIREIARTLFHERIGAVPIIDDSELPIGIITRSDILRCLIKNAPLELWI